MLDRELMRQIQAEEDAQNGVGADFLRGQLTSFRAAKGAGLIKNELPVSQTPIITSSSTEVISTPEIYLVAEWKRQSSNFDALDFHKELKQSRRQYLESLPVFGAQPEAYKGRFDSPMLVEVSIPWQRQAILAGIAVSEYLQERINQTIEWADNHTKTPRTPFTGWFNKWGQEFPDKISPFDARIQLASDAVGASPFDGVAQEIHHPEVTASGKYFDLIGYSVGSGSVPSLYRWIGGPGLSALRGGSADDGWRPLVHGSEIGIK